MSDPGDQFQKIMEGGSWRLADWLFSVAFFLLTAFLGLFGSLLSIYRRKVDVLEKDHSTLNTLLATVETRLSGVGHVLEEMKEQQSAMHRENMDRQERDSQRALVWREQQLGPYLRQMSEKTIRLEEQVSVLKKENEKYDAEKQGNRRSNIDRRKNTR